MSFVPRTFETIRDDMINFVKVNTTLTDFEIGSNIRTVLEAAALEDDEQYFQMVQLLDAFSIRTASGSDLDARVAEFGIVRLQPASAAGNVTILDRTVTTSTLVFSVTTGGVTLVLASSASFPIPGPVFTVRVGEGTIQVEDVTCTANTVVTNTLIVSALVNDHNIGATVSIVTGTGRVLAAGIQVQVPASGGNAPILYVTTEGGSIVAGNISSTPLSTLASIPGVTGNVGPNQIVQFTAAPPFSGAAVNNLTTFAGGRGIETDPQLRDRALGQIQSLSRGTPLAIKQAALGVADPVTGQRVVTANILEDFIAEEVILYVDDGTGFTPSTVPLARSVLTVAVIGPVGAIAVADASAFPATGFVMVSPEDVTQIEMLEFSAVTGNILTLVGVTTKLHNIGDEAVLVDLVEPSAEAGTTFLQTQNFPIVRSSDRLWVNTGGGFLLQSVPAGYFLHRGTGQIELGTALLPTSKVAITYTYYTGLVQQVQKVISGDITDPVNFPGVSSSGVIALVETPLIRRVTVRLSISAAPGFNETDLTAQVQEAVESYVSGLGIGNDVIIAAIIEQAMSVNGMFNCVVITPTSDIVVFQNELPVPFDANGNSLVTAT